MSTPIHAERLRVPVSWWILAFGFALSLVIAIWAYLGIWWGLGVAALSFAVTALLFESYGRIAVRVDERGLQVGRSLLGHEWIGGATVLDAAQVKKALGPGADARAWYVMRSYIPQAVRIDVDDPADPHPFWLVSSRRADHLASVINDQLTTGHPTKDQAR